MLPIRVPWLNKAQRRFQLLNRRTDTVVGVGDAPEPIFPVRWPDPAIEYHTEISGLTQQPQYGVHVV